MESFQGLIMVVLLQAGARAAGDLRVGSDWLWEHTYENNNRSCEADFTNSGKETETSIFMLLQRCLIKWHLETKQLGQGQNSFFFKKKNQNYMIIRPAKATNINSKVKLNLNELFWCVTRDQLLAPKSNAYSVPFSILMLF